MAFNYYDEETILKAVKEERQYIQRKIQIRSQKQKLPNSENIFITQKEENNH